jgi:predicted chitinase
MQPVNSAAMNGIGISPVGPVEGTSVIIIFADPDKQQPIILGSVGGVPDEPGSIDKDDTREIFSDGILPAEYAKPVDVIIRTVPHPRNSRGELIDLPATNKIKFYDKEKGRTDLTTKLKVNDRVVGFGIPEDTYIVSIDSGTEITISSKLKNYDENILSFDLAATNQGAVFQSKVRKNRGFLGFIQDLVQPIVGDLNLSGGQPSQANSADASPGAPTGSTVTNAPSTSAAATASTTGPTGSGDNIPTSPPPKSGAKEASATRNIQALIAACDKVGLTSKEQKAAVLGIVGGETKWELVSENTYYREDRFREVFKTVVRKRPEEEWTSFCKWESSKKSPEGFFSYVYGPTVRGPLFLGNETDADGGKYYGRGFIQFTGKATYQRYQDLAKKYGLSLNIVANPDSLNDDVDTAALVTALYFVDRVSKNVSANAHPGYFQAAKKAVGYNVASVAQEKQKFYEYFYGKNASNFGAEREAGAPEPEKPETDLKPEEPFVKPGPSKKSTQSASDNIGFRDPNNKYPLKDYLKEPDTNRLARGVVTGTAVEKKDSMRVTGVPKAMNGGTWDQPEAPFGALYPYNKVFETESGHIQEWDDTPGQERIHTYHRSGTFSEVDANGTQVNYIVGDSFTLMERNGCIRVAGECNITVDGDTNIYARSDANIQVEQNATIDVGNNLSVNAAVNTTITTGLNMTLAAFGDLNIKANNLKVQTLGKFEVVSANIGLTSQAPVNIAPFVIGVSLPASLATPKPVEPTELEIVYNKLGNPLNKVVPYLEAPERRFEERTTIETPEEWDTPEGRSISTTKIDDDPSKPKAKPLDEAPPSGGSGKTVEVDTSDIRSTTKFGDDYRLSKNFTLGMLIDGGTTGRHKLVDQNLADAKGGPTRVYTVQEIVSNLAYLANNCLEPILDVLPGGIDGYNKLWKINSGYRLKGVVPNESATSGHCKGQCVDIGILGGDKYSNTYDVCLAIEKKIPYDQVILEYRYPSSVWIHIGFKQGGNRKQAFTMVNDRTYDRGNFVLVKPIPTKA